MSPSDGDEVRPDEPDEDEDTGPDEPDEDADGDEPDAEDEDADGDEPDAEDADEDAPGDGDADDEPDESGSDEPDPAHPPRRGWLSLYALAFALVLVAAGLLVLSVRSFLQDTGLLAVSAALSGAAIVVAILSVVLPGRRGPRRVD